jgi:hypothetical protein
VTDFVARLTTQNQLRQGMEVTRRQGKTRQKAKPITSRICELLDKNSENPCFCSNNCLELSGQKPLASGKIAIFCSNNYLELLEQKMAISRSEMT